MAGPPYTLPPAAECYKQTPIWDPTTLPSGLLRAHSTKEGVWAKFVVLKGSVTFVFEKPEEVKVDLKEGEHGVVAPRVLHHVEPKDGSLFRLEFYREPGTGEGDDRTGVGAIDKLAKDSKA